MEGRQASRAEVDPALMQYALDHVRSSVYLMRDDAPRFVYVNEAASRSLGYSREELTSGLGVLDINPGMSPEGWGRLVAQMREKGYVALESTHRARDGRAFPVEVTGNRFVHDGVTYIMAITRDISERKAAETALRASERAYRTLIANTPDLVVRWNHALDRVFASPSFAQALGVEADELVGSHYGDRHALAATEALRQVERAIREVFDSGASATIETPMYTVEGPRVLQLRLVPERDDEGAVQTVLGIGRDITVLKEREQQLRSLTENLPDMVLRLDAAGRVLFANERYRKLADETPTAGAELSAAIQVELSHLAGASSHQGQFEVSFHGERRAFDVRLVREPEAGTTLAIVRDVTAQRVLERQFVEAQKMEAVGRLAGGIAHDFNNLLIVIQMQAELLAEGSIPSDLRDGLGEIVDAAQRATTLTRQLLTFSRRQVSQPVHLDVGPALAGMSRLLLRLLGEDVAVETKLAAGLPAVHVDPGMFEQVVMNLAINARDAMPGGGRLTLALDAVTVGTERGDSVHPGSYVRLAVTDTGNGIAADVLPRIFEPFFTTKEAGKGTGLGLATVLSIVQQHEGFVDVSSTLGQGTTFFVYLPATTHAAALRPAEDTRPIRGGTETVLLVEDDPATRGCVRAALARLGYRVIEADSPTAALELWSRNIAAIDVVVTDLAMPRMSGEQLAARLLAERPQLGVVFMSGHSPDVLPHPPSRPNGVLLAKPFSIRALADAVRRGLDPRGRVPHEA